MTKVEQDKLLSMREILLTAIKREEEMFTRLAAQEMQHKRALEIQLEEIDSQLEIDRALSYDI